MKITVETGDTRIVPRKPFIKAPNGVVVRQGWQTILDNFARHVEGKRAR